MSRDSVKNIPTLIRRTIFQAISFSVLAAFVLSFSYTYVYQYQQKAIHVQNLGELLASNASSPDGANLVARQVSSLLEDDPTLQSILFYSTDQPISDANQTAIGRISSDWYNALFSDSISFNYPVTSRYLSGSSTQRDNTVLQLTPATVNNEMDTAESSSQTATPNALVGYINITLDIHKLRWQWIYINLLSWFATICIPIFIGWFLLRKLNQPTKDLTELVKVCDVVIDDPELEHLPVIQQKFYFQELLKVKKTLVVLFDRLQAAQKDYQALADFELQLHNKDLSLDMQRSNFQSMITHELKTSLNAISGGLQLLDNQYLNDEQKDTLAIIRKGSQHLEFTLEQIIQLNKIEKGQVAVSLNEFNPLQMIADLLLEFEPVAKKKGLDLVSRVHHTGYMLEGDTTKIQQILTTLINNAIKFTENGQVVIESQLTHLNESMRWQVHIIDTGIGIEDIHFEDIFLPFFQVDSSQTREYEGIGVGLSVIKQIAQLIGASIEVSSDLGVGSHFVVTMPLRQRYQSQQQSLLQGINILYCHQDETGFEVETLQRFGANVTCHQHAQLVLDHLAEKEVAMVMFAEEVPPERVERLAKRIREHETTYRTLLIYWYPPDEERYLDDFEPGLKAAGVDYCHSATRDPRVLSRLLSKWLY